MPMNKLSELSKPVAYIADCGTIVSDSDPFFDDYKNPAPLYSQEYVSALEQREGRSTQRMTEMEADLADKNGIILEQSKRIAELNAKLATPVQLPVPYSENPWMSPDPDGTWFDKGDVKESIRSAGFTVEGDE